MQISRALFAGLGSALVVVATVVLSLEGCATWDPCAPGEASYVYSCDGNVILVHGHNGCGDWSSRATDCAAQRRICMAGSGQCVVPCATDADCAPNAYCSSEPAVNGSSTCRAWLGKGAECSNDPRHCGPGLACRPLAPTSDAGAGDAATDGLADATEDVANDTGASLDASSAEVDASAPMVCQDD